MAFLHPADGVPPSCSPGGGAGVWPCKGLQLSARLSRKNTEMAEIQPCLFIALPLPLSSSFLLVTCQRVSPEGQPDANESRAGWDLVPAPAAPEG